VCVFVHKRVEHKDLEPLWGVYSFTKRWSIRIWSSGVCVFVHKVVEPKDLEPLWGVYSFKKGVGHKDSEFLWRVYSFPNGWSIMI